MSAHSWGPPRDSDSTDLTRRLYGDALSTPAGLPETESSSPTIRGRAKEQTNATTVPSGYRARGSQLRAVLRQQTQVTYREAILAAAERLMLLHGQPEVKVADIAAAAGIATGTFYGYFKDKETLLAGTFAHQLAHFRHQLEPRAVSRSPFDQLRQLVERVLDLAHSERARIALLLQLSKRTPYTQRDATQPRQAASRVAAAPQKITDLLGLPDLALPLIEKGIFSGSLRCDMPARVLLQLLQACLEFAVVAIQEHGDCASADFRIHLMALFANAARQDD